MERAKAGRLAVFLLAVAVLLGGVGLAKGGLYVGKHEGDTLHLVEIVFRMARGEWPHLDFMTPIGVLAFAPIALFVWAGQGIGMAILWSQVLVVALLLPAVWYVARSRFPGALAYGFGFVVVMLCLALVHGESQRSVSISMHYNRWSWAVSYLVVALAALPDLAPGRSGRRRGAEGAIIGLGMAAVALTKVTYLAAFAPPVLLALILRREWAMLAAALLAGLAVAGLVTALAGPDYWLAYLRDVLTVAQSESRPQPGEPLSAILGAPAYLGVSLVAIAGVILLRQSGARQVGLIALLLFGSFAFVTFQNFGNDPQWLPLFGLILLASLPAGPVPNALGWDTRMGLAVVAAMAFAMAAPSVFNLAYSPFRHIAVDTKKHAPILPGDARNADLQTLNIRANRVDARIAMDTPGSGLEAWADKGERDKPAMLNGEVLPFCSVELGMSAWFDTVAADLVAAGYAGKKLFVADLFGSYWLFDDLAPLPGGAPWYYGGLSGLDAADYVVVPRCAVAPDVQARILTDIGRRNILLREVRRTPLYVLAEKKAL